MALSAKQISMLLAKLFMLYIVSSLIGSVKGQLYIRLVNKRGEDVTLGGIGVVQIFKNDKWTAVCNNNWNRQSSAVLCSMLGFSKEDARRRVYVHGATQGIGFDKFNCSGSERSLSDCKYMLIEENAQDSCKVGVQPIRRIAGVNCLNSDPLSYRVQLLRQRFKHKKHIANVIDEKPTQQPSDVKLPRLPTFPFPPLVELPIGPSQPVDIKAPPSLPLPPIVLLPIWAKPPHPNPAAHIFPRLPSNVNPPSASNLTGHKFPSLPAGVKPPSGSNISGPPLPLLPVGAKPPSGANSGAPKFPIVPAGVSAPFGSITGAETDTNGEESGDSETDRLVTEILDKLNATKPFGDLAEGAIDINFGLVDVHVSNFKQGDNDTALLKTIIDFNGPQESLNIKTEQIAGKLPEIALEIRNATKEAGHNLTEQNNTEFIPLGIVITDENKEETNLLSLASHN